MQKALLWVHEKYIFANNRSFHVLQGEDMALLLPVCWNSGTQHAATQKGFVSSP